MKRYEVRDNQFPLILSLPDLRYLHTAYTAKYMYRGTQWQKVLRKIEIALEQSAIYENEGRNQRAEDGEAT